MTTAQGAPIVLTVGQLADLRRMQDKPRHPLQAQRRKLFMRLGLIIPTEDPRPPREGRGDPPPRAHEVTLLGRRAVAEADAELARAPLTRRST